MQISVFRPKPIGSGLERIFPVTFTVMNRNDNNRRIKIEDPYFLTQAKAGTIGETEIQKV